MLRKKNYRLSTLAAIFAALGVAAAAEKPGRMEVKSPAFQNGGEIPRKHTCDGGDASPRLTWTEAPPETKTFALIADDPDAPGGTWVHWVIYDLPATVKELPEGTAVGDALPNGAKQGINDFRKTGYGGPCPPPGAPHRYFFRLYALDAAANLKPRATKQQLLDAIKGHVVAEAELVGKYGR
jgi:Raf kinase inhibitor-like YbhB/YbcL family protein